jgi:septal ring factor EnvC (AmiA/AmiB activator)
MTKISEDNCQRFQDGGYREEAESVPPKVKSWRDAGDTPYRKTTEKRQNFDSSTPPACAQPLQEGSCRIEQIEDRISELQDEMVIKGKTKELLVKQLNTCEKKMQELTDSIQR